MAEYFELLPPTALGEFSITMRGEDAFGTAMFVDDPDATIDVAGVDIDADLDARRFDRIGPDYLQTTKGIPLFSPRFADSMPEAFARDVSLVPATIHLRGATRPSLAGRIERALDLIDAEASSFSEIRGSRILTRPAFLPVETTFLLARERTFRFCFVASEDLIRRAREHHLRVEHVPA